MSNIIYHKHHIIPKYMGGTDDESNLVRLTIAEHAQAHLDLYNKYHDVRDHVAYRMLLGQIDKAEALKIIQKLPKTKQHKKKISEAVSGSKNGMYGRKQSDKQKKAASDANKIPKPHVSENMKKRHAEGKAYQWTSKDNPRSRSISGDGVTYDCIADCQRALGFKNHNAITYRVKHPKWTNWFYV